VADGDTPEELPATAGEFAAEYPEAWDAYTDPRKACSEAGPIDGEGRRLVKLALAAGAGSEGTVHSHVRPGSEEGIDPETLRHVAVLAIPTLGCPDAMAAATWIEDETERFFVVLRSSATSVMCCLYRAAVEWRAVGQTKC